MNAMSLIRQLMASKNPNAMIQSLPQSNPKIAPAIPVVQEIMAQGGSKKEQLQKACKKSGMNAEQVENQIKSFGINID